MRKGGERAREEGPMDSFDGGLPDPIRLGHDLRFLLVCVGGGAARIGAEILRHPPRYVESVAVNCDPRVQELECFDRRVFLSSGTGDPADAHGSPQVGGALAHAAEPALERLFEGAHFVTIVASLGGGSGTGVLPYLLDAASRSSWVLSLFLVKPFACEGERRAVAERAMARLHFVESFVDKQQQHSATLEVLDNELLVPAAAHLPMRQLNHLWASRIGEHLERTYLGPVEGMVEASRLARMAEVEPARAPPAYAPPAVEAPPSPLPPPPVPLLSATSGRAPAPEDAELTFEVDPGTVRGPTLQ